MKFLLALVLLTAATATTTIGLVTCVHVERATFHQLVRLDRSGFVLTRPDGVARLCHWRE